MSNLKTTNGKTQQKQGIRPQEGIPREIKTNLHKNTKLVTAEKSFIVYHTKLNFSSNTERKIQLYTVGI
jgi:hypothetical protein